MTLQFTTGNKATNYAAASTRMTPSIRLFINFDNTPSANPATATATATAKGCSKC